MIEIMGKKYLTEKEAASRYGYSQAWFMRSRNQKFGPPFVQLAKHRRVFYPLDETDEWFRKKLQDKE